MLKLASKSIIINRIALKNWFYYMIAILNITRKKQEKNVFLAKMNYYGLKALL